MTPPAKDEYYMMRCIELAEKGLGITRQNPLVGSVVAYNDRIIGEGYHHEFGGHHAEVLAIRSVKDKSLLKKSVLYVNLEPCSHYGKTPPCSIMIKDTGIPRIVIGCIDPNPEVSGKGIEILKSGGAEVITGILEAKSRFLNRRFFTFHLLKRPYVILKWAESSDGFIDKNRTETGASFPAHITNHTVQMLVHKWRGEEISIMTGTNTILLDNPDLTVREWPGINPVRIIPDKNGRLFEGLKVMDGSVPTLVFTDQENEPSESALVKLTTVESFEIPSLLKELYVRNITSVFVEGGAKLLQSFIDSGFWDETFVFSGNKFLTSGVKAPVLNSDPEKKVEFRGNSLLIFRNKA